MDNWAGVLQYTTVDDTASLQSLAALARLPYTIEDVAPLLRGHTDLSPQQRRRDGEVQPGPVVSMANIADVKVIVKGWMEEGVEEECVEGGEGDGEVVIDGVGGVGVGSGVVEETEGLEAEGAASGVGGVGGGRD